jgi:hypothetical protein
LDAPQADSLKTDLSARASPEEITKGKEEDKDAAAREIRAAKVEDAANTEETSILHVPHAFHPKGPKGPSKLFYGTPLKVCRSYPKSQQKRAHPPADPGLFVKCHDSDSADAQTSLLYDSKKEVSVQLWRAVRNLCLAGCDCNKVRRAETAQRLETNVTLLNNILGAVAQISPDLERLDLYRFRSDPKPKNALANFGSSLTELHLSWGSYSGADLKALVASSGETLRRLCVVILDKYLSIGQLNEALATLHGLQELNLSIFRECVL